MTTPALIDTFSKTTVQQIPEIKGYHYDFDREEFTDKDGVAVTPERFAAAAARDNAGRARAGKATVRRAIFIQSLISSPSSQRPRLLENILARSRTLVTQGGLDAMFNRKVPDKNLPHGERFSIRYQYLRILG